VGQEIECRIRYREQALAGKAFLESDHLVLESSERLKVLFKDMKSVRAEGGVLRLEFDGGPAELELGGAAEQWAQKILNPPSRLHKLGIRAGMTVLMVGDFDAEILAELNRCRLQPAGDRADLIFLAAERKAKLAQIGKLAPMLNVDGALWVVYPKDVAEIRENDVIHAGRAAQLKDRQAASFSLTHTGLKFVIPLALRRALRDAPLPGSAEI
jgi:hypothetical protein